jgi:probable HAF family extracellular repeat protein
MTLSQCFTARSFFLAVILSIGLGFISPAFAQQVAFFMVDIDNRAWTRLAYAARDINNNGDILANSFIVSPNATGGTDFKTLRGDFIRTWAINVSQQVVGGLSTTAAGDFRAFITGPEGMGLRDLGALPGHDQSFAYAINNAGQVVGASYTADGLTRAFITRPNGMGMRDLGTLPGHDHSYAEAINEAGQVAGSSDGRAFITGPDGVGMRDLGALPGHDQSFAYAINNAGQVAGQSRRLYREYHAFITGPNGVGMSELDPLPTGGEPFVYDINNAGQVAGAFLSLPSATWGQAFVTGPNGAGTINLNSLIDLPGGYNLERALAINDRGQVLAVGIVPEPETYALMLAGLGLIGFMVGRKQAENAALGLCRGRLLKSYNLAVGDHPTTCPASLMPEA